MESSLIQIYDARFFLDQGFALTTTYTPTVCKMMAFRRFGAKTYTFLRPNIPYYTKLRSLCLCGLLGPYILGPLKGTGAVAVMEGQSPVLSCESEAANPTCQRPKAFQYSLYYFVIDMCIYIYMCIDVYMHMHICAYTVEKYLYAYIYIYLCFSAYKNIHMHAHVIVYGDFYHRTHIL